MYGRGAAALARELGNQGVDTDTERCQTIIDGVAAAYPQGWAWLQESAEMAVTKGYVETSFGRRRYFSGIQYLSSSEQNKARRQAKNSRIQGLVADLLAKAGINLYRAFYRSDVIRRTVNFRILLPIHDAFLFEVYEGCLPKFIDLARLAMSTKNFIPGTQNYLDIDIEVMDRWGEH